MPPPKLKGARKATNYRAKAGPADPVKAFDKSASRLGRKEGGMQTYDEVMELGGDEDHFHLNRDKMLLDDFGTTGYAQEDDDSLHEDDEIYSLPAAITARTSRTSASDEEQDDTPLVKEKPKKKERKPKVKPDRSAEGRFGHTYDPKQDVVFDSDASSSFSEEEEEDKLVLPAPGTGPLADMAASSDDEKAGGGSDEDEYDDDRWNAAQYHATRNDRGEADSDDEEAAELELVEAKRLQRKARERLAGGDFGVESDEEEDADAAAEARGASKFVDEDSAEAQEAVDEAAAGMTEGEAIAHLLRTQPETLALVDDFVVTASKIKDVERDLEEVRTKQGPDGEEHPARAVLELEYQALSTYLPLLAFYFSLLLSPLASRSPSHPQLIDTVLERLSSIRQSLATMEELDLTSASYGGADDDEEEMVSGDEFEKFDGMGESEDDEDDEGGDEEGEILTESMLHGLDDNEVEAILSSMKPSDGVEELMRRVREKRREKGIATESDEDGEDLSDEDGEDLSDEDDSEEEEEEEEEEAPPSKKRKASSLAAVPQKKVHTPKAVSIPTLAPLSKSSRSTYTSSSTAAPSGSDYLDPTSLSTSDILDKSTAKKSLRFHVSQVAQKTARREQRGRQGLEGDDEAPRKSKEAARRAVLQRQQHGANAKDRESTRLDDGEFGEEDRRDARAVRGEVGGDGDGEGEGGGEDEEYYNLVSAEKGEGRKAKKVKYDEERAAEKAELHALSQHLTDGPRGASRQILANKGLTPKRKKENRNARVKKRLRYDKAQKKLGSMQATFKGPEARTGYEGEKGGIVRRNVKSRKFVE